MPAELQNKTNTEIEETIRNGCSKPGRLTIVLLDRNIETVIAPIRDCGERERDLIEGAMRNNNARDRLLCKVGHDLARRTIRNCVRERVPSFERAVRVMCDALRS